MEAIGLLAAHKAGVLPAAMTSSISGIPPLEPIYGNKRDLVYRQKRPTKRHTKRPTKQHLRHSPARAYIRYIILLYTLILYIIICYILSPAFPRTVTLKKGASHTVVQVRKSKRKSAYTVVNCNCSKVQL